MKKLTVAVPLFLLTFVSLLLTGCPGKNSPSSPAAPAPTNTFTSTPTNINGDTSTPTFTPTVSFTPTATNPGGATNTPSSFTPTLTSTFTFTSTFTYTSTFTSTATNTATNTFTSTATATPTNSFTPTNTGTPTNTATSTATNTPCQNGQGTPCTSTPTETYSPTPIYTNTWTPTSTWSSTPTPDCTGTYSISGSVSYSGSTISGDSVVIVAVPPSNLGGGNGSGCNSTDAVLGSSAGNYTYDLGYIPAGSYYLIGLYGTFGNNGPNLGDYVGGYSTGSGCGISNFTPVTLSSSNQNPSGIGVTFGNTYQLWGVNAAVTYSGPTTYSGQLEAGIFSALNTSSGTYTEIDNQDVSCNSCSGPTTAGIAIIRDTNSVCTNGASVYVMAWYGNSGGPSAGNPYAVCCSGSTATEVNNSTSTVTINFSNTNIWP